jgi:hypothetical protein
MSRGGSCGGLRGARRAAGFARQHGPASVGQSLSTLRRTSTQLQTAVGTKDAKEEETASIEQHP